MSGQVETELVPGAKLAAEAAGRKYHGECEVQPDVVLTSPRMRAINTAFCFLDAAGIAAEPQVVTELDERGYGQLEGLPTADVLGDMMEWQLEHDRRVVAAGGESLIDVHARQAELWLMMSANLVGRHVMIFGHATAGRALMRVAQHRPYHAPMPNVPNATPIQVI